MPSDSPSSAKLAESDTSALSDVSRDRAATAVGTAARAKLLVVIATYDEIDNLPRLVEALHAAVPWADLLVIDDGSPDGTGRWADERSASDRQLTVIHRPRKSGLGSATLRGFREGIDRGYDLVATIDADFSHPPERLAALVETLERNPACDVAIGSRYVAGGGIEGWPWRRRWMSRWVNRYARWWLRLPVRDCSGAFRVYRAERLAALPPEAVRAKGYAYLEEILFRLKRRGARFVEVPFVFRDRTAGRTKIDAREAIAALLTIGRLGWSGDDEWRSEGEIEGNSERRSV